MIKLAMYVVNNKEDKPVDSEELMLHHFGKAHYCDFEEIGIQSDGTGVIFDKCGNFEYLETDTYTMKFTYMET